MRGSKSLVVCLLVLGLLGAPSAAWSEPEVSPGAGAWELAPEGEAEGAVWDPWERYNRAIFAFNEALAKNFAEPIARGWEFVFPKFVRECMRNFFVNLAFPIRVLNTTLQAKPIATGQEIARFALNSTFGLVGLFDVAGEGVGMPLHKEDFGQTLGFWGVPPGPYFVLPVFGPSSVRDTFGLATDVATGAVTFSVIGVSVPLFATFGAQLGNYINTVSFVLDDIGRERESSLDFYASARNAYLRFRENQVHDRALEEEPVEIDDDLYYLEDEELETP